MAEKAISSGRAAQQLAWLYCALLIHLVRNIARANVGVLSLVGSMLIVTVSVLGPGFFGRTGIRFDEVLFRRLMPTFFLQGGAIGNAFRYVWVALIVLALAIIVLLVMPPLIPVFMDEFVSPSVKTLMAERKAEIKAWLDFTTILLEVSIAVCIGGAAFSEGLANRIRERLRDWQTAYTQAGEGNLHAGVTTTVQAAGNVKAIRSQLETFDFASVGFVDTIRFYLEMMEAADDVMENIRSLLLQDYPKIVRMLFTSSLIGSFPGGIYGMVAFTLFCCLMLAKVMSIYVGGTV